MAVNNHLDITAMENWLWDAACVILGPIAAPKYKDYILPLIFLKRLSDVFEDEVAIIAEDYGGNIKIADQMVENDHGLVRFYLPSDTRWPAIAKLTKNVGERLTDAVREVSRANPALRGVLDITDYNATAAGMRIIDDEHLYSLIQALNKHRLGKKDVEPDLIGRAYEYLLRKFAEGGGSSAGEFYTPQMVGVLMARLLNPLPGMTAYDPACGSFGLQIKLQLRLLETHGEQVNSHRRLPHNVAPLKLYGQEINATTFAMARMNAFIHDLDATIAPDDTMRRPAFKKTDSSLETFDLITANPMWNQKFPADIYEEDPFGRFDFGIPPSSSADWGWVQHMAASLKPDGRMAVVLDTGAVSRGSGKHGSNKERDIRKKFVEKDWIEAVILLPENLFYNATAAGLILVINKNKIHPKELLLVDGSSEFNQGRPKNEMMKSHVEMLADIYDKWNVIAGLSEVVNLEEVIEQDYNLSPRRYISPASIGEVMSLQNAARKLRDAEEHRKIAAENLDEILKELGLN